MAQSALSVASLAVQGIADVETLGGDAPTSLFCLTIAVSGERKSGCDKLLMAGLREFEASNYQTYIAARAQFVKDSRLWEAKQKRLITVAAGTGTKALLFKYYKATEEAQRPNSDLASVQSYASKSAEQAARIAGVLTLWADQDATEISVIVMGN